MHYFKRSCLLDNISVTDSVMHVGKMFRLQDVPSYADFTNLFDQYKICGIKLRFVFNKNSSDAGVNAAPLNQFLPNIYTVIDYDDGTALSGGNANTYLEYSNCHVNRLDRPFKRYFRPHIAEGAYGGVAFTRYANKKSCWLDTDSTDVEHYGAKYFIDGGMMGGSGTVIIGKLQVFATFYIACKNVR